MPILKTTRALAVGFMLAGCVSQPLETPQPDRTALATAEVAKYDDLRLCNTEYSAATELGGMGPNRPEYHGKWIFHKATEQEIASRHLNCYKVRSTIAAAAPELSTRQKQARVSAVCNAYTQRSQFADPSVIVNMCQRGYQATPSKCSSDQIKFNSEVQKLTGAARAEYIEIGNAFRAGCNLK
ncbi:hypothetical protein [Yersinia rochesterensis]|uniref:hypothetical protein n=1 Tax=Yersinia rochesterensis TaxID=1604335 RepID=UPI0011A70384|nr:hypothetical protein [Yersinia rochesterensis]EKN5109515.1 hypothetical protein [Yersinia enterocolitica]